MSMKTNIEYQCIVHVNDFNKEKVVFNLNPGVNGKPQSALWTSTLEGKLIDTGWISWCNANNFGIKGHNSVFFIKPKANINVFEIETLEDALSIIKSSDSYMGYIDYKKLAKDFHGIHFTWTAVALGKVFNNQIPLYISSFLNIIDCESTVWFDSDWIDNVFYACELSDVA